MLSFIAQRVLVMIPTLLLISIISFVIIQLPRGDYLTSYIAELASSGESVDEDLIASLRKRYGLDQPIYVQYVKWLVGTRNSVTGEIKGGILRGDFGYSRTASQPVADLIKRRFPATLELTLWAVVPVVAGGIVLGVIAAVNHNKPIDHLARVFAIVGWSFPDFVFGLLVLMFFYANLRWFPPGRVSDWANQVLMSPEFHNYTQMNTVDALLNLRLDVFWDALRHLILPVITLSYLWWALQMRVTRSSMLETLRQD